MRICPSILLLQHMIECVVKYDITQLETLPTSSLLLHMHTIKHTYMLQSGAPGSRRQCSRKNFEIGGCWGVESKALVSNLAPILRECQYCTIGCCGLACVWLFGNNCRIQIGFVCYDSYGGCSSLWDTDRGYIWTIGGYSTPQTSLERTLVILDPKTGHALLAWIEAMQALLHFMFNLKSCFC